MQLAMRRKVGEEHEHRDDRGYRSLGQDAEADSAPELPEELERIDGLGTKMLVPLGFFTSMMYPLTLWTGALDAVR